MAEQNEAHFEVHSKNHDMKHSFKNIALEGTCNGDVVGGLYREPRENL